MLLAISAPVLAVGLAIAFLSKANANWATPCCTGLALVATRWLVENANRKWLAASFAIALSQAARCCGGALAPRPGRAPSSPDECLQAVARIRNAQGPAIARGAQGGFEVLAEDREDMASLLYYTRRTGVPILMDARARPSERPTDDEAYAGAPDRVLSLRGARIRAT
ncbi:MAG: hypothetical protein U1F24_00710 [Alphaproteobacteria bacterium]